MIETPGRLLKQKTKRSLGTERVESLEQKVRRNLALMQWRGSILVHMHTQMDLCSFTVAVEDT